MTTTAAAPSEICEADPAVIVPSLLKAGRRPPSEAVVVSARMPSSFLKTTGSPLRCGMLTGTTSSSKRPSFHALAASLVAARRELVLLLTREGLLARVGLLGEQTHRLVGEGVPEAVEGHVVAHRHVAVLVALA